jgi:hypothetical protein
MPSVVFIKSGASNVFVLLGRFAAHVGSCLRAFRAAYRFHLQGLSSPIPLRMEPIGYPETSAHKYQHTLFNAPDDLNYIATKYGIQQKMFLCPFAGHRAVR